MARKSSIREDGYRLFRRANAEGIESGPWWYDMRVGGHRFKRSTRMRDKAAARKVAEDARSRAERTGKPTEDQGVPTVKAFYARFLREYGGRTGNVDKAGLKRQIWSTFTVAWPIRVWMKFWPKSAGSRSASSSRHSPNLRSKN